MSGTTITYNGITIQDVLTEGINQAFQFDSTGVDPLFLRTTIKVIGTVILDPDLISSNMVHGILLKSGERIESVPQLMLNLFQPRRNFKMTVCNWILNADGDKVSSNQTWFDVKPAALIGGKNDTIGNGTDVNNGPKVTGRFFNVTPLSVKVELTFELCSAICDGPGDGGNQADYKGIINFRFWIGEEIDGLTWLTRRTYTGRLRIANRSINVHNSLRNNIITPPILPGFKRQSIRITESPNGLELNFTVTDQELYAAPPYPAITWEGSHNVSTSKPGGSVVDSEVNLTVTGAKGTDKRALIVVAQRVIEAKLHILDLVSDPGSAFLQSAHYTDHFTSSRVEAGARIRHTKIEEDPILFGVWADTLGGPLHDPATFDVEDYNRMRPVGMEQSATTVGLFRSALQDPCNPASMPQGVSNQLAPIEQEDGDEQESPGEEETVLDPSDNKWDESHNVDPHTIYLLSSRIQTATGVIRFPMAQTDLNIPFVNSREVRIHNARSIRRVEIEAQRLMKPPAALSPESFTDDNAIGHTCRHWDYEVVAPILSADGRKTLHQLNGLVVFDLDRTPTLTEGGTGLPGAKLPYMSADAQEYINVPPEFFVKGGNPTGDPANTGGESVI